MSQIKKEIVKTDTQNHFQKLMPMTSEAFERLAEVSFQEGVLTAKTKELIAIGIAVHSGCDDCINYHIHKAVDLNLTRDEILEAMGVGLEMGAGQLIPPIKRALKAHFPDLPPKSSADLTTKE